MGGGNLTVDSLELDYGDVLLGSKPVRKVTLVNVSGQSLEVSNAKVGDKPFALKQVVDEALAGVELPHILGVGESIDILVRFKPSEEGSFSSDLKIASEGFPNRKLRIPLRGNGVSELGLSHRKKINFGKVATNVFHQRSLVLKNNGARVLAGDVITNRLSDEFFTVAGDGGFTLTPGATKTVTFEFGATGECEHQDKIKIVSDGLMEGKAKLKVSAESVDD